MNMLNVVLSIGNPRENRGTDLNLLIKDVDVKMNKTEFLSMENKPQ